MRWGSKRILHHEQRDDTTRQAMGGQGGVVTALVSAFALIFSAVSLYETVLKRASLKIYVPPVVHYARNPGGEQEMFAIPITVANHGARDAAITSIEMNVTGNGKPAGEGREFFSAYFVDASFFAKSKGFDVQTKRFDRNPRQKLPFAPISVAGRGSYTGTILFNVVGKSYPHAISEAGEFRLTLRLRTELDEGVGGVDEFLSVQTDPITLTVRLPYFSKQTLSNGTIARLHDVAWDTGAKQE
ncbi:MAG: hypothetical protein ACR2O4_04245 [Hyphomicrobiaceae bacterium]